jgi:hypothetical protein
MIGAAQSYGPGEWDDNPVEMSYDYNILGIIEAPVPEPTTIIVWSLLGGLAVIVRRRLRKAA